MVISGAYSDEAPSWNLLFEIDVDLHTVQSPNTITTPSTVHGHTAELILPNITDLRVLTIVSLLKLDLLNELQSVLSAL